MTDVWEKIKKWFQRNWPHVLSFGLTFLIGFIIGRRKSVSGVDGLVEQLRDEIDKLRSNIGELRSDNERLAKISEQDRAELERIEIELSEERRFVEIARSEIESGRSTTSELSESLGGLRELLSKHRSELEKIKVKE